MTSLPIAAFLFLTPVPVPAQTPAPPPAPVIEYSDAYNLRAKVHKIGSFAMLPLAGTEFFLGQSLYNNPSDGKKGAHVAVGATIGGLFAVNTVTGVWNLYESRKDPNGRTKRWVHALLMMTADAGFLAAASITPESERGEQLTGGTNNNRALHRTLALSSLAIGTVGYLVMLIGR